MRCADFGPMPGQPAQLVDQLLDRARRRSPSRCNRRAARRAGPCASPLGASAIRAASGRGARRGRGRRAARRRRGSTASGLDRDRLELEARRWRVMRTSPPPALPSYTVGLDRLHLGEAVHQPAEVGQPAGTAAEAERRQVGHVGPSSPRRPRRSSSVGRRRRSSWLLLEDLGARERVGQAVDGGATGSAGASTSSSRSMTSSGSAGGGRGAAAVAGGASPPSTTRRSGTGRPKCAAESRFDLGPRLPRTGRGGLRSGRANRAASPSTPTKRPAANRACAGPGQRAEHGVAPRQGRARRVDGRSLGGGRRRRGAAPAPRRVGAAARRPAAAAGGGGRRCRRRASLGELRRASSAGRALAGRRRPAGAAAGRRRPADAGDGALPAALRRRRRRGERRARGARSARAARRATCRPRRRPAARGRSRA